LRRVVPRVAFYKKVLSMKLADLRDKFKKASKTVQTSFVVVCPNPLSPTPSISSAMRTPENTEEDPDDLKSADEGDIQIDYSSDQLYSSCIGAVTKYYL
jgi:hypothetical protein